MNSIYSIVFNSILGIPSKQLILGTFNEKQILRNMISTNCIIKCEYIFHTTH